MSKLRKVLFIFLLTVLLAACGGSGQSAANMEPHGDYDLTNESDDARIINEVLVDDENFKMVLISVEHTTLGPSKGQNHAKMYLENKTDTEISVSGLNVLVDGVEMREFDFFTVIYEQESDTEILRTYDFDGDLPKIEKSLALDVIVSDYDTYDDIGNYEIDIEF